MIRSFQQSDVHCIIPDVSVFKRITIEGRSLNSISIFFQAEDGIRDIGVTGVQTCALPIFPPRQVRLDTLTTTKRELALDALLADDSTFYGDLFPHAVQWHGELYLEDGLHRALRAALQQRNVIHVRVLDLDALTPVQATSGPSTASIPVQPPVPNPRRV